jgi:hypothetical protein
MPSTYSSHTGALSDIPQDASPGLRFLAAYVPAIDSLDAPDPGLDHYISPEAKFFTNKNSAVKLEQMLPMFASRGQMLLAFGHGDYAIKAWDLEGEGSRRTVIFESVSKSVFKTRPDNVKLVHELNILELDTAPDGKGVEGLWITAAKTYMDLSEFK